MWQRTSSVLRSSGHVRFVSRTGHVVQTYNTGGEEIVSIEIFKRPDRCNPPASPVSLSLQELTGTHTHTANIVSIGVGLNECDSHCESACP